MLSKLSASTFAHMISDTCAALELEAADTRLIHGQHFAFLLHAQSEHDL